jgi:hypothetical protein
MLQGQDYQQFADELKKLPTVELCDAWWEMRGDKAPHKRFAREMVERVLADRDTDAYLMWLCDGNTWGMSKPHKHFVMA